MILFFVFLAKDYCCLAVVFIQFSFSIAVGLNMVLENLLSTSTDNECTIINKTESDRVEATNL